MYEKFTDRARRVMQLANQEAQRFNHEYIATEHILLGLIKEGSGVAATVLKNLDVSLRKIRLEVEKLVQSGADMVTMGKLPQTPRAKNVIMFAIEESHRLEHDHVGTEHILLGLLKEEEGVAAQILINLGLSLDLVRMNLLELLSATEGQAPPVSLKVSQQATQLVSRILDAAANRANEGLRVVEDFVRFVLDDGHLTQVLKQLRHELAECLQQLDVIELHASRDTTGDVGTSITTHAEADRSDTWGVCRASLERTKQALRSLEEFSKVDHPELATRFEALRYQLYTCEKALSLLNNSRSQLDAVNLCVLVDGRSSAEEFTQLLEALVSAGVPMIQLRDKQLADVELVARGRILRKLTQNAETLMIVNDRPDIAVAVDADGVHLGQDDMTVKDARAIVGPQKLIGVSTHHLEQARAAVLDGANYLGAGPTFPSATKEFATFAGLDYLRQLADEITLPTFAIGGINAENVEDVLATGVTRMAVSSAVVSVDNPAQAAQELLRLQAEFTPAPL